MSKTKTVAAKIGLRIMETRKSRSMTIADLRDLSGVSANMISRIERGLTEPGVSTLMKIADAFEKSLDFFISDEPIMPTEKHLKEPERPKQNIAKTTTTETPTSKPNENDDLKNLAVRLAKIHDGECLSSNVYGKTQKLMWRCKKGHRWWSSLTKVSDGTWCRECHAQVRRKDWWDRNRSGKPKKRSRQNQHVTKNSIHVSVLSFQRRIGGHNDNYTWKPAEMESLANILNGHCDATKSVERYVNVKWECARGHRWESTIDDVINLKWCPECDRHQLPLLHSVDIRTIKQRAVEQGGKCFDETCEFGYSLLRFQCAEGHKFVAQASHIKKGEWCPQCHTDSSAKRKVAEKKLRLENLKKDAEKVGTKCLSSEYINGSTPLDWTCDQNHKWSAPATQAQKKSFRCPECKRIENEEALAGNIVRAKEIAKSLDGRCLSDTYPDGQTKLTFECKKGHTWKQTLFKLEGGNWCPECKTD